MEKFEQLVSEVMHDAARHAPPPKGVSASPRRVRRANGVALLAAVATLIVVSGGAILFTQDGSNSANSDQAAAVDATLVGFGGVAMPLPDGWSIGDYKCGQPQSNTVNIQPSPAAFACAAGRNEGASDIVLDDLDSPTASQWSSVATDDITLDDGTPAQIGSRPSDYENYTTTVLVIPQLEAILVGTSLASGQLDDVLLATGEAPEGMVAVPQLAGQAVPAAEERLDGLGLEVELESVPHPDLPAWTDLTIRTRPEYGVFVAIGSTVIVEVGQ